MHLNPPSPSFLSTAHGERDVAAVAEAYKGAAEEMARVGLLEHRPPAHGPGPGAVRSSDESGSEDALPLLPNAVRFLEERRSEGLHHWNVGGLLQVTSRIDVAALRAAVGAVLERHDALRMRFRQLPDGHWQTSVASVDGQIPLELVDLTAVPAEDQDGELALGNDLAQAGLDLSVGPLIALRLIDLGGRGQRLHVFMHHLVMDGLSWRPFWRDLLTAYHQRVAAVPLDLGPASTSFGHWARGLQEWAGAAPAAEVDRWINQDWASVRALPVDLDGGADATANTNESARMVVVELTAGETQALLHETPAVSNKVDLLLTALAGALASWTGSSTVLIDMMGHGRDEDFVPDADLFDTVGFFISYTPMVLTVDDPSAPTVLTEQIHGALRGGAGFDVLRTMSPDDRVRQSLDVLPRAEVLFNYLGRRSRLDTTPEQPDPPLLAATQEPAGRTHHPRGLRYYPLSVSAEVWAGQLRVTLVYSENLHRRETVEALAEDVRKGLLRYI